MDFSCELAFLKHLVLEIRLEGLHHRLQGRIKEIDLVIIDFKLLLAPSSRICNVKLPTKKKAQKKKDLFKKKRR